MKSDWSKSPDALVERFWDLVPDDPRVQRKQMFGYPCAVIGGNMFMSLHGEQIVLRLPEQRVAELVHQHGYAPFEPMAGRPMKGYVAVALQLAQQRDIASLVQAAFEHGAALPPKEHTARKAPRR